MKRSPLSVAFDILGILNLVAATGCLAVFFWAVAPASQAIALKGFTPAFAMMLLFFALGRLAELFELVHAEPIVERRGRETTAQATQQEPAADTGMATKTLPQPLTLRLVEPPEKTPAKSRRDAA